MTCPVDTGLNVRNTDDMSEQEMFLVELKYPGFVALTNACDQFMTEHHLSLINIELQMYTNRDKTFKILVSADNPGILLVTKEILRELIKKNTRSMVHIQTTPSNNDYHDLFTLTYYVEL